MNAADDAITDDAITIEVVHALPEQAERIRLQLASGTTLAQALTHAAVLEIWPDAPALAAGIFGKRCEPSQRLRDGDRIELYRPLLADPKAARRERAGTVKPKA